MRGQHLQEILKTLRQKGYTSKGAPSEDLSVVSSAKSQRKDESDTKKKHTMLLPFFRFDNDMKKDINPEPLGLEAPKETSDYVE